MSTNIVEHVRVRGLHLRRRDGWQRNQVRWHRWRYRIAGQRSGRGAGADVVVVQERLCVYDHLGPILENVVILHPICLGLEKSFVRWMAMDHDRIHKTNTGKIESRMRMPMVSGRRWWNTRVNKCALIVQVLPQTNNSLAGEDAEDRALVFRKLCIDG